MQTNSSQDASTLPGGDYNAVPYVSTAIVQSHPARLFALAKLFGLTPPAMETASILELGCASGGNIIPLAARFPRARFVGIDLTPRHVDEGQTRIRALGLTNIEIQQGDVTTLELSESFDCVICHGVYSWVPPAAREAILRIAARNLKRDGIAYISYNVFPGWQMRGIIRDLMLFHAGHLGPPDIRIAMARGVLDTVAKMANPGTSYGARLREEARALAMQTDAYILGEFLAPDNAPCYFRDFTAAAERQGLVYLCDSAIEMCLPETHGAEVAKLLREMSGDRTPADGAVHRLPGGPHVPVHAVGAPRAGWVHPANVGARDGAVAPHLRSAGVGRRRQLRWTLSVQITQQPRHNSDEPRLAPNNRTPLGSLPGDALSG